jgi:hypothetical protein
LASQKLFFFGEAKIKRLSDFVAGFMFCKMKAHFINLFRVIFLVDYVVWLQPKKHASEVAEMNGNSNTSYSAIAAVALIIVGVIAAVLFFMGGNQPAKIPQPEVTSTTNGWGNYGFTYVLYVTVGNNGASGNVKVFAEVKAVQSGTTRFAQTEDRTVYLDGGGSTTITIEFNSEWFTISDVTHRAWTIVP